MNELTNKELNNIEGGALRTTGIWIIVGAISSLVVGVLNGVLRPLSCKSAK